MRHNIIFMKSNEAEAIETIENLIKEGCLLLADSGYLPDSKRVIILEGKEETE